MQGRSAILDVHAVDSTDKEFNVEIQRKDAGAGAKRARHNSSLLDAHILKSGDDTENIPDSYVIFITENDVMKGNQPIYPVERYVTIGENKVLFGDGSHIIYVLARTLFICFVLYLGLSGSGIRVRISPSVLYLMVSTFTAATIHPSG